MDQNCLPGVDRSAVASRGDWLLARLGPLLGAVMVGVAAGLAGAALTLLLHLVQHLAFGYTENTFLFGVEKASSWRRVVAMTAGGLLAGVGWWQLRRRIDIEAVSVTRALREPERPLPLRASMIDAALQIVAVGVGGSLGREGAPRQAGAALADALARRWRLSTAARRTLIACGAGAGLAAVYNVPVAGAFFALELLLQSCRARDVVLAAVACAVATVVAWPFLSMRPTYDIGPTPFQWQLVGLAVVLGPFAGAFAVGFVRVTSSARLLARRDPWPVVTIPVAFAAVGAVAIAYPQLLGNGKGQAQLAFSASLGLALAATLVLLKPLATSVCLAGGAIGGLLTPALATGAALGALAGQVARLVAPGTSLADTAIIGAAAFLAVTQRAPLMAVVITLELAQGGLQVILPVGLAVALGVATAMTVTPDLRPLWWDALAQPGRRIWRW